MFRLFVLLFHLQQDESSLCVDPQLSAYSRITQHLSEKTVTTEHPHSSDAESHGFKGQQRPVVAVKDSSIAGPAHDDTDNAVTNRLPPNVDPEVFVLLPDDIQKELLSPTYTNYLSGTLVSSAELVHIPHVTKNKSPQSFTDSQNINDMREAVSKSPDMETTTNHQIPAGTSALKEENISEEGGLSFTPSSDCEFPGNVDPAVFSELPADVQRELMSEWKQQKPALKSASSRKPARSSMAKDRKAAKKSSQGNNLFKYFKPS